MEDRSAKKVRDNDHWHEHSSNNSEAVFQISLRRVVTILYLLIPLGLAMGLVGLGAFAWGLRSGQYEDLAGAAVRILRDEDGPPKRRDRPDAPKADKETS